MLNIKIKDPRSTMKQEKSKIIREEDEKAGKYKGEIESPSKRKFKPFTSIDKTRDYRAMYRAACNFHERNNPPIIDSAYWGDHEPGQDETPEAERAYWENVLKDMQQTANSFNNDAFITGVLFVIYDELEREYKTRREAVKDES